MEKHVTFPVGDITLEGLVSLPTAAAIGAVVCHPHPLYGGEMLNNVVSALVKGFGKAGIATLRFNFRGVGRSGGRHDDGNAEQDDVKAAVSYLLSRQSFETVVVAGYSFGSMVGLKAGADDARVHKLIGVALPIARRDASFLEGVAKPKLLISGDCDDISPASQMQRLVDMLAEPRRLVLVPGADHFFGGMEQRVVEAAVRFLTE
ncbi:MAG: alpha/beta fold hydrolase [Hyphomicrobiaceae bacterium]|nr:alpha/beta fold hydrolase [Hyphomicrobiaceae bacterium]